MASARDLVRSFMSGARIARPPLLPIAFYHAARLDGAPFEDVMWDATRLSRALLQQRELLGGDCLSVRFDDVWLAETAGVPLTWSGELPQVDWEVSGEIALPPAGEGATLPLFDVLLDVIDRMCKQLRRSAPVMAVLPGPLGLGARSGNVAEATTFVRDTAERCCRAGAELVMLCEPAEATATEIATTCAPILNTIRYYNAFPIIHGPRKPDPDLPEPTLFPAEALASLPQGRRSGLVVPDDCIADPAKASTFAEALSAGPVFLAVFDDALVQQSVEANAAALKALLKGGV